MAELSPRHQARRFSAWLYEGTEEPDVRFTLANERTFLAWIRTALGCLALAVAADALEFGDSHAFRVAVSVALTLFAVILCVHGWWSWVRTERAIRHGDPLPRHRAPVTLLLGMAGLTVVVALAVVV
jgi:putative membrane protein